MFKTRYTLPLAFALASSAALVAQSAKHPITLDDIQHMSDVRDPQCSPDGLFVAYVVSHIERKSAVAHHEPRRPRQAGMER